MVVVRTEKEELIKDMRNRADRTDIQVGKPPKDEPAVSGFCSRKKQHSLEARLLGCDCGSRTYHVLLREVS